jgi:Do/DeqQ family serine protease
MVKATARGTILRAVLAMTGAALLWTWTPVVSAMAKDGPFARETPVVIAVRQAGPAVVNISTRQVSTSKSGPFRPFGGNEFFDQFFRDFFEPFEMERTHTSLGSGVIIDGRKKLVLTNDHVVARASEIKITLANDQEFMAESVGSDPDSDLAVLQVKTDKNLPSLTMGDSSDLMIGETVIAIGNPFGLTHTVTTGVISAVNRTVSTGGRTYRDFIQTDASINPGNSGGPLLNINGQLIGINTAIYDRAEGIGFAIPIDKAKRIIKDLISYGEVLPAWLGLSLQPMDDRLTQYFRAPASGGALITEVDPDGPAAGSGLTQGDVVVGLDSDRISSVDDYEALLQGYTAGAQVTLTVHRLGAPMKVKVTAKTYPREKAEQLSWDRYGLKITGRGGRNLVLVKEVRAGSPAAQIGLASGDTVLQINEIKTTSEETYLKAMTRYRFRVGISAIIQRGNQAYRITLVP